jgi:signal transduction histidine kinase
MTLSSQQLELVFVFFIYGLAFFSMGIALVLETSRSPLLGERRALLLLAIFGLLHGVHEWAEIILVQGMWLGAPFPAQLAWLRVGWLALSFVPLLFFSLRVLDGLPGRNRWCRYASTGLLAAYGLLLLANALLDLPQPVERADALARYLLAVPAGLLASWALSARARQLRTENHLHLANHFRWAALGFGVYGLSQLFVSPVAMFPAQWVNASSFAGLFGVPVQVLRAGMAVLITTNLIRAMQLAERGREAQLKAAQQARLEALEQVQRDLIEREALRRELLRHIVIAQEDERARIARELHDETAQFLTALNLNLATLGNSVPRKRMVAELLDRLQVLTQDMSEGIYRMVHDLRPAQLDDLGLVAALQYLADEERRRSGLEVDLGVEASGQRPDPLVETVLFRVAQEALTNVARHAHCRQARVQLQIAPDQAVLRVSDEGSGFQMDELGWLPRTWGLAGMRERVESVGGQLVLQSAPGKGTLIEVVVPVNEAPNIAAKEAPHENHPINAG